jgi:uncharacterized membrane protein YgcG
MDDIAIWIALLAVFIALIPAFSGAAAKARRERERQARVRRHGDNGTLTTTSDGGVEGRKSSSQDAEHGWGSDGAGSDGGGGGGGD